MTRDGERIGRYSVTREIGRGGMGIVYEARDPQLNRPVALKVLPREMTFDQRFVTRFLREGRVAASLSHPNVVTVYEAGEAEGRYYLAMEFVEGTDLARLIREKGRLDLPLALEILGQAAAGLDAAHTAGIVHRDIKPENILLGVRGSVKVADFGIARAQEEAGGTRTGMIIGTVAYMSPEQALGKPVDARSDIYSLACVAYEMLAGDPPFGHTTAERTTLSILNDHAHRGPAGIRMRNPGLARHIEHALARALSKDPAARFARATEFVAALQAEPAGHRTLATMPHRAARAYWRFWVLSACTAILVPLLLFLVRPVTAPPPPPSPPPPPRKLAQRLVREAASLIQQFDGNLRGPLTREREAELSQYLSNADSDCTRALALMPRFTEALRVEEQVRVRRAKLQNEIAAVHRNVQEAAAICGRYDTAVKSPVPPWLLAKLHRDLSHARYLCTQAIELQPESEEAHLRFNEVLFRLGLYQQALDENKKCARKFSGDLRFQHQHRIFEESLPQAGGPRT